MPEVAKILDEDIGNPYTGLPLEELAQLFKQQKDHIAALNREIKNQETIFQDISNALIEYALEHPEIEDTKIKGVGRLRFYDETVYNVTEWNDMYKYISDNNAFYLLHRRVSNSAIEELLKTGEKLPVAPFTRKKIGLTKG